MNNGYMFGNIFQEACLFEEKYDQLYSALQICQIGLLYNPKFGPLHLIHIRIHEKIATFFSLKWDKFYDAIEFSLQNIAKELQWKIFIYLVEMESRQGNIQKCRNILSKIILNCPIAITWKIWLLGFLILLY